MWNKIKGAGSFVAGLVLLLAIATLACLFIYGGAWIAAKVYPLLSWLASAATVLSLALLVPLSFLRRTRGAAAIGMYIAAQIVLLALWVWALLLTLDLWGVFGVIVGVFLGGVGVIPVAMLATLFHGHWSDLVQLVVTAIIAIVLVGYSYRVAEKADRERVDGQ